MKVQPISGQNKQYDGYLDASGFEQFGVRYYNPSLGRWTQQDPVGGSLFDLNSANRYIYASDDPVNQVDPSGKFSIGSCIGAIAGTILGSFGGFYVFINLSLALISAASAVPYIGPLLAVAIAVVAFVIVADAAIFLYNTAIAPNCGLPQTQYIPLPSAG